MSWNNIIQEINTNIADNDQQLITAEKVRTTLLDIVGQTKAVENAIYDSIDENVIYLEQEDSTVVKNSYAYTVSYCNSYFYDKDYIDDLESNVWHTTDDLDDRVVTIENYYATTAYLTRNYYDKTQSNQLYKPTGLFFYFGDNGENECNCKVSYVNFINEDGPSGDFYLIEGSARYGLDNSLVFNINRPYGSMYSATYSMGLYDVAAEAFTKALGAGHTPQIHKFCKNVNLTIDYPSNPPYQGNEIIVVANVNCDDEYIGDVTFSLVSAYNQTNVPIIINFGFRCWVQDVQQ